MLQEQPQWAAFKAKGLPEMAREVFGVMVSACVGRIDKESEGWR